MDVCKDGSYLECSYTNGYKYKVDEGFLYRKDWDTDEVEKIKLTKEQIKEVEEFDVFDPFQNGPTWCFLRDLWCDATSNYGYLHIIECKESEFK